MAYAPSDTAQRLPLHAVPHSRTLDGKSAPRAVLDWTGAQHTAAPSTIPDWSGRGFRPRCNPSLSWRGDAGRAVADPSLNLRSGYRE
jgi:hypothetical protein